MQLENVIKSSVNNKCSQCRMAECCLPAKLDKKLLHQISQLKFKAHVLEPGQFIYHQGEKLNSLFAIRSGLLKSFTTLEDGKEYVMSFHLPPDLFGWEAIDDEQLSVSVMALDYTNVCEIPLPQLEALTRDVPDLEIQLLKLVSQRIGQDNTALLRTSAEQRVADFLLQLTKRYTSLGYPNNLCKLLMTHQDIANYLRITPETISRTFRNLQKKGVISIQQKDVHLNDIERLKDVAQIAEVESVA